MVQIYFKIITCLEIPSELSLVTEVSRSGVSFSSLSRVFILNLSENLKKYFWNWKCQNIDTIPGKKI